MAEWTGWREVGLAGWVFLAFFFVLAPGLMVRTARRFDRDGVPEGDVLLRAVLPQQAVFGLIAAATGRVERIPLPFAWPSLTEAAMGAAVVLALAGLMYPLWRWKVRRRDSWTERIAPRTPAGYRLWALVSLAAGLGEELVWRGVAWALVARLTGDLVLSAAICSAMFGFLHLPHGWANVALAVLLALGFHAIVWWSGSVWLAMGMHAAYDQMAGLGYGRLVRLREAETS